MKESYTFLPSTSSEEVDIVDVVRRLRNDLIKDFLDERVLYAISDHGAFACARAIHQGRSAAPAYRAGGSGMVQTHCGGLQGHRQRRTLGAQRETLL